MHLKTCKHAAILFSLKHWFKHFFYWPKSMDYTKGSTHLKHYYTTHAFISIAMLLNIRIRHTYLHYSPPMQTCPTVCKQHYMILHIRMRDFSISFSQYKWIGNLQDLFS